MRQLLGRAILFALGFGAASLPAGPLLQRAIEGPLRHAGGIVFANRLSYEDGHWYANIGYYCNDETLAAYAGNGKPDVGRLCRLDLVDGRLTVLLDAEGGSIRDPAVDHDGRRVLFAWRRAGEPNYLLHEIGIDGTDLRQVTDGPYDDYEPTYLPDGGIAFVSTRCRRWVNCWKTQVGTLHRCDRQGGSIVPLSANLEHDNTPAVLPDGRILYTRWEYVDRSQVGYHHLWVVNPDGTRHMTSYGNQQHYPLFIAAQPIPGTPLVLAVDSPGHGRRDHYGYVSIIDPRHGPDDPRGLRRISKEMVTDPFPLAPDLFLVAKDNRILLMDAAGKTEVVHTSEHNCYEPRPVVARPRERLMPSVRAAASANGVLLLEDVYRGRRMEGVRRGDIRKLLVLETLPKPVNFSGGPDLLSWLGTFTLERVLGTVPVESDGSAHFEVPPNRAVFFVALDDKDLSVKRMQSFTNVVPGEVSGCVGCHEPRVGTPSHAPGGMPLAARRAPSRIEPFADFPDVIDFQRDIQPVLDRNCVSCHNLRKPAGGVSLEGDLGPVWSLSWYTLFARLQVADGRNGFGNQPPRSIGTSASPLMRKIDGSHHGVRLSARDWRLVWLWIESAAAHVGSYAALRNEQEMRVGGQAQRVFGQERAVLGRRCGSCHNGKGVPRIPYNWPEHPDTRGIERPLARHERRVIPDDPLARFSAHAVLNLSRPELSPLLLAPLAREAGGRGTCGQAVFASTDDPDYQRLLTALTASKQAVDAIPRYGTPGFQPNRQYVREMRRFGILPPEDAPGAAPLDHFELDRRYWESLW